MKEFSTRFIDSLVSMRAKIIALGLQQVGRQAFTAIGVEKGQRGAEGRDRNALLGGGRNRIAPAAVGLLDGLLEERVQHQIGQLGVFIEGFFYVAKKPAANDAAAAPHQSDTAVIEVP